MSITGISSTIRDVIAQRPDQSAAREPDQQQPASAAWRRPVSPKPVAANATAARQVRAALEPQAPEGTDPALWSILTHEERSFFANRASSGPLTYTKVMMPDYARTAAAPAMRGGRVDIRV
ncbi:MAG: hypothetical protein ACHQQ3_00085 [Gemmatimonadales bacterium]